MVMGPRVQALITPGHRTPRVVRLGPTIKRGFPQGRSRRTLSPWVGRVAQTVTSSTASTSCSDRRNPMRLLALLTLACLGLAPLPAWAQAVKVGAVVPLTGRYGAGGAQVRAGYEIAVEHLNAAGGVMVAGKKVPIELTLLDAESDATKTVSRLETLAAQGVVAYLGGFGSDLHAAAASVAEKNKTPYLGVAFALHKVHEQGFKYLFSPFWKSPDIKQYTVDLLNAIPAADRPKAAAIFQEKTDWGREMATAWTESAKQGGYQIAMVGEYAPGAKDFSDLILKAKGAGADLVLGLPTPPDGMTIVKQMKELGLNPKMTLLIRAPDPITGPAYANVQILAAAISHAGSLDKDKIRDAIAATDMTTVIGPVKFRPDGTGIVNAVFVQWLNGKQELVFPKEAATAPLGYPAPPFAKR